MCIIHNTVSDRRVLQRSTATIFSNTVRVTLKLTSDILHSPREEAEVVTRELKESFIISDHVGSVSMSYLLLHSVTDLITALKFAGSYPGMLYTNFVLTIKTFKPVSILFNRRF